MEIDGVLETDSCLQGKCKCTCECPTHCDCAVNPIMCENMLLKFIVKKVNCSRMLFLIKNTSSINLQQLSS